MGQVEKERLEEHLLRIAAEVRSAGLLPPPEEPSSFDPADRLSGMSRRQSEIVHRLLLGERVPQIARAMRLSPSTVRNHLSTVFRKFGVHSQIELIAVLRPTERPKEPGETSA